MSLAKTETIDRVEVDKSNVVYVRKAISITENGSQLSVSYHRWSIAPGQDYSNESDRVKAVCAAVHTPEVIEQYVALTA